MERRHFIRNLTLAGAGLGMVETSVASESDARTGGGIAGRRIRVGLIGCGNLGVSVHLRSIIGHPDCHLAALCDVDRRHLDSALEAAREQLEGTSESGDAGNIQLTGDFREVLANRNIDAVVIVTPDHWHVPMARAAVMAGKHVYVEKPVSLYVTEGRELVDLVREHNAILQVGSQHRSSSRFFLAQAAVQSGLLGRVDHADVQISTREGSDAPWEPQPVPEELDYNMWVGPAQWIDYHPDRTHYSFRFVPEISGGEIANWGAHYLDSAMQALGLDATGPVAVKGAGRRNPVGSLHTSYFGIDVDYTFPGGITMKLRSDDERGITLRGTEGTLFVNRETLTTDPPELLREIPKDLANSLRKTPGSHFDNWVTSMQNGRPDMLHAPIEIGHAAAILCHLANIAIELDRPLFWDSGRESFRNDAHANALLNRPERSGWDRG